MIKVKISRIKYILLFNTILLKKMNQSIIEKYE